MEFLTLKTYLVTLLPSSSFTGTLQSDTLFGAVCWALATLKLVDVGDLLANFNDQPRFAFSSAFPYLYNKKEIVRFWPAPLLPPLNTIDITGYAKKLQSSRTNLKQAIVKASDDAKLIRKASHWSEDLFKQFLQGQTNHTDILACFAGPSGSRPEQVELSGGLLVTTNERRKIFPSSGMPIIESEVARQRNHIDRMTGTVGEGLLYYELLHHLRSNVAGLWCLVKTDRPDWLKAAFRYLEDTGIGGRRKTGRGKFTIKMEEWGGLRGAEKGGNAFISLSHYLPRPDEWSIQDHPLLYRMDNVRGKHEASQPLPENNLASAPINKDLVRMFAPGSIFPSSRFKEIYGQIVPVGNLPGRTVWTSGMALGLPARIGVKGE